ncbi:MAG: hypothetical protein R2753_13095 [Chitinophagales bacterium]
MIFNNSINKFLKEDDILEVDTFGRLTCVSEMNAFKHDGFLESMDTFKENIALDTMWKEGEALEKFGNFKIKMTMKMKFN